MTDRRQAGTLSDSIRQSWRRRREASNRAKRRRRRPTRVELLEDRRILAYGPLTVVSVDINASMEDPDDLTSGPQTTSWAQQRSDVRTIEVTFSRDLEESITTSDLSLVNLGVDAPATTYDDVPVSLTNDHITVDGNVLTLTFDHYELDDGVYQLDLYDTIEDADGVDLDGDHDATAGGDFQLIGTGDNGLFKFAGDFSGDAFVDADSVPPVGDDWAVLMYWYGQSAPPAPDYMNLDGDSGISIWDYSEYQHNVNQSLTFPANVAPDAEDTYAYYDHGDAIVKVNSLANDNDVNGRETLDVSNYDDTGVFADVTLNGDSTFTFEPFYGAGTETFSYTVSDGDTGTSTAGVTVTHVNDDQLTEEPPYAYPPELRNHRTVDPDSMCSCVCTCHTDEIDPHDGSLHHPAESDGPRPAYRSDGTYGARSVVPMNVPLGDPEMPSVPINVEVSVSLDSVDGTSSVFATGDLTLSTSDSVAVAAYVDASSLETGFYELTATVTRHYYGYSVEMTHQLDEARVIVNRQDSEFGGNWFVDELDRLLLDIDRVALVRGDNSVSVFEWNSSSSEFDSPPGTFSSLTESAGTFTLSYHNGGFAQFDSDGLLELREDRNGNQTTYAYTDADGDFVDDEISTITDPFGRATTFQYDSGLLDTVPRAENLASLIA